MSYSIFIEVKLHTSIFVIPYHCGLLSYPCYSTPVASGTSSLRCQSTTSILRGSYCACVVVCVRYFLVTAIIAYRFLRSISCPFLIRFVCRNKRTIAPGHSAIFFECPPLLVYRKPYKAKLGPYSLVVFFRLGRGVGGVFYVGQAIPIS